jgi:glycosyltransferase involved in cell wall biosynthesis
MATGSKRLRVLFVVDHASEAGGAERFATGLAVHMPRERVTPWVCSTRSGRAAGISWLAENDVPHVSLGRESKWQMHRLAGLVRLLRRERFDVLHAHKFGSNLWGTLTGRACGVPVVIAHEHNWSYDGDPVRVFLDGRVIGRLATRFLTVSRSSAERMITLERVPAEKVSVMPTAYIPHTTRTGTDLRVELGIEPDAPVIGVVAVLRPEKALDVLLDAHALLLTRLPEARLVIAGDGRIRRALEAQIQRLGTGRAVHLLGVRHDVDDILRQVDVAAMSSDWEGMPLFVFECMAAEKPLVATAVGGLPEIVQDGKTGLLVPPRDPAALAEALQTLLTQPQVGRTLAAAAASRLHKYSIDAVANEFADLYERLVEDARGS